MARRIASVGYWVALPNLYYRKTREFVMEMSDAGMKRMFAMMQHLTNGMIASDTGALLRLADADPAVRPGPAGVVGYCMSGPFAVSAAAHYPERIAAAASIYGARLVTDEPDSAHRLAAKARRASRTGSSGTPERSTASRSRSGAASTTSPRRSGTGSGSSRSSPGACVEPRGVLTTGPPL